MAKNTTTELPVWVQDVTVDDIGRRNGHAIQVYVHGYWGDVITIYIRREYNFSKAKAHLGMNEQPECYDWTFSISHSSGGRDTKEVLSDIDAEANFAQGLMAAVQHARLLRSKTKEIEAAYQQQAALEEERANAAKAEKQAAYLERVKADKPLGADASMLLNSLKDAAKQARRAGVVFYVYGLGEEKPEAYTVRCGVDGVPRFSTAGRVVAAAAVLDLLAKSSIRSHNASAA